MEIKSDDPVARRVIDLVDRFRRLLARCDPCGVVGLSFSISRGFDFMRYLFYRPALISEPAGQRVLGIA